MSEKTTLRTQHLHEMSRRDTHESQGKDVDWIQEQLDVGEELEWAFREKLANAGQEEGLSRRIHVSVYVDHALNNQWRGPPVLRFSLTPAVGKRRSRDVIIRRVEFKLTN